MTIIDNQLMLTDRLEKTILTNQDWYPTINGKIRVLFTGLTNGKWRVYLWGMDDFGLEYDFDTRMAALEVYNTIPDYITIKTLRSWGFYNA